jgi:hypothetical protein
VGSDGFSILDPFRDQVVFSRLRAKLPTIRNLRTPPELKVSYHEEVLHFSENLLSEKFGAGITQDSKNGSCKACALPLRA